MFAITEDVKKLLSLTDLVLLDIKHIDAQKCKDLVGVSNTLELDFAKYLSDNNIPIWARQVIVPGITDDEADLIKLGEFLNSLKTLKKLELLPYHDMGKTKWEELGFDYLLKSTRLATTEDIKRAQEIIEKRLTLQ